jgi:hypothetical protein
VERLDNDNILVWARGEQFQAIILASNNHRPSIHRIPPCFLQGSSHAEGTPQLRTCIIERSLWVIKREWVKSRGVETLPRDAQKAVGLGDL